MSDSINFDNLPGMVHGLRLEVSELKTLLQDFVKNSKAPVQPDEQRFYGDKELAKYLNCTIQTVSRQKQAGKLPFHRIGRRYYYLRSEVDAAFKGKKA